MSAPRRTDHRRPLVDPHNIGDCFASGLDIQDFEEWVRLTWYVEAGGNGTTERRKVAAIILPKGLIPVVVTELGGGPSRTRRH